MILKIADAMVDSKLITFSHLRYGNLQPPAPTSFKIYLEQSEWEKSFSANYESLIIELKADDEKVGVFQPPYAGASDYPSETELMAASRKQRMEIIEAFLIFDILRSIIAEDNSESQAKWIITKVNDISNQGIYIIIDGTVAAL